MNNRWVDLDDFALVTLVNGGDQRAFDELFLRHKTALYRHAYRMTGDTELCNDIIQDVFLNIWTRHAQWNVHSTPLAYLYQAVRHRILDHISHEKVVAKYMDELLHFQNEGNCFADEQLLEKDLFALIEEKKQQLPHRTKEIFELNREQHLSYKEIAEKLHISEKTAKKQVHNALRYLRTKLALLLIPIILTLF
ncbi:RNA polymerase sigma factor [Sphingobacterium chungjuense]|uniref:RNA polymerase sigma factor n=1 Tax=Sphingobacterium chungjuense TaxID=2675553 RepID=UPI001407AA29|nr:RNA polymerase sigma-70 factor [Sphingobacterium chungjuense]